MRTTFVITPTHELVSAVRSQQEPHALTVGTRIVLATAYVTEYGAVPAGAKGFVEYVDDYSGTIEVLMEGIEPALFHWHNTMVMTPFTCEDIVACIRLPVDKQLPKPHQSVPREEGNATRH
jgi:hypothetical protein